MMKKPQLFIVLLLAIGLLAFADYKITAPAGMTSSNNAPEQVSEPSHSFTTQPQTTEISASTVNLMSAAAEPNVTQMVRDANPILSNYQITQRRRTTELFERFDVANLSSLIVYKSVLLPVGSEPSIQIYEIHTPSDQASVTYLNLVANLESQLNTNESFNRTNEFGQASLYYNQSQSDLGFLMTQVNDVILGFRYSKASPASFETVKAFISTYQSLSN